MKLNKKNIIIIVLSAICLYLMLLGPRRLGDLGDELFAYALGSDRLVKSMITRHQERYDSDSILPALF